MSELEDQIDSQLEGAQKLVDLSKDRSVLAQKRTNMNYERTYMNYERTLSVWTRTAIAAMVFGIALDRLSLMYYQLPSVELAESIASAHLPYTIAGVILVAFSVLMALSSGLRFINLTSKYKDKNLPFIETHKTWLPAGYVFMVALFGILLIVLMLWIF